MFGMSDPEQVITQFERYADEGRLEIAEVMSTELVQRMLEEKSRSVQTQELLIRTIRSNASILLRRNKFSLCKNSCLLLRKQRKLIKKMIKKSNQKKPQFFDINALANDYVILGCAEIGLKHYFRAKKSLKIANKLRPADVETCIIILEAKISIKGTLNNSNSDHKKLIKALDNCGPVILDDGKFVFQPKGYLKKQVNQLVLRIENICNHNSIENNFKNELKKKIGIINNQIMEITEGKRAANAELAEAMDKLDAKTDYYSY
tara:strand:- start:76 stop:861 length:786 start_codon:yes stop_codon:yes gene_type:complete